MTRKPDWQSALSEYLDGCEGTVFKYGRFDCCLFVCDAILAMTGTDVAAAFRGKYSNRIEAIRAIHETTGRKTIQSVVEAVTTQFGMKEVNISLAQRGDVVLLQRCNDYSVGIVDLSGKFMVMASRDGIYRIRVFFGYRCWSV
jgi:hypothetical protein